MKALETHGGKEMNKKSGADLNFGVGFPNIVRDDCKLKREFLEIFSGIISENSRSQEDSKSQEDCISIARGIINRVEYGLTKNKPYSDAANEIIDDPCDFLDRISHAVGSKVRRLMIVPCPDYIISCIGALFPHLEQLYVYDNLKAGRQFGDLEILPFREEELNFDQIDACFLATTEPRIAELFLSHIPQEIVVNFTEIFMEPQVKERNDIKSIVDSINAINDPVIVLSSVCSSTLLQTYKELNKHRTVFFVARYFVPDHPGYGVMPSDKIDITHNYIVDFYDMLYLLKNIQHGSLIFVAESFFHPDWDARLTIPSYAYSTAIMRYSAVPSTILLYDAVKPIARNFEYEGQSAIYYEQMLKSSGSILLSSNSTEMGDFLRHSCARQKKFISFFRYSCAPSNDIPKIDGGFHMAAISVYLGEFKEPSRDNMVKHIVSILDQKIHFHYYSNQAGAHEFRDSLREEIREYLHIHPIILDQKKLVEELTQYHCGWVTSDLSVFGDIISESTTRFYKDIFAIFPASTIPSSALVFACAGLPIITNRGLWGVRNLFPEGCTIPLEMSEVNNLSNIILEHDWEKISEIAQMNRHKYTLEENIGNLIEFLKQ